MDEFKKFIDRLPEEKEHFIDIYKYDPLFQPRSAPLTEQAKARHFSALLQLAGEKYMASCSEGMSDKEHNNLVAWAFSEAAKELKK